MLFVVASIEQLPCELEERADEVTINLPWGSLLSGLVCATESVLAPLARLARPGARVSALLSVTPRDAATTGLPAIEAAALRSRAGTYRDAGFVIERCGPATRTEIAASGSSWAKRLGRERDVVALVLRRARDR